MLRQSRVVPLVLPLPLPLCASYTDEGRAQQISAAGAMCRVAPKQQLEQREALRRDGDVVRNAQFALLDVLQQLFVIGATKRRSAHDLHHHIRRIIRRIIRGIIRGISRGISRGIIRGIIRGIGQQPSIVNEKVMKHTKSEPQEIAN